MPAVSVILCTVRIQTLPYTVQSLLRQTLPDWELVVVDQSQSPEIGDYLASLCDARVRHHLLETRGLSQARNAGMKVGSADILAFTDDDCEAAPDWLETIHATLETTRAELLFGPVTPPEEYNPAHSFCPTYLPEQSEVYSWERVAQNRNCGLGANMSLHRRAVETVGMFDPLLGAGARFIPSGEEVDYVFRALGQGLCVLSAPIAAIRHTYGARPGDEGKSLQWVGNFAVGAVHEKHLRGPYAQQVRPALSQFYRLLRWQILNNLARGRGRHLGINRLRALMQGRAYLRKHFQVDENALLVVPSPELAAPP